MFIDSASNIIDRFRVQAKRESLFSTVLQDDYRKWGAIRKIYNTVDTSRYVSYVVDWTRIFTPIESAAWGEIRYYGLPFYPQYPVGKFFSDFADPVKKLVIECDGKAFHNKQRDEMRDKEMASLGWEVFRVAGSDCKRIVDEPWEEASFLDSEGRSEDALAHVLKWAMQSVDGLAWAISVAFYGAGCSDQYRNIASDVLRYRSSNGARKFYA